MKWGGEVRGWGVVVVSAGQTGLLRRGVIGWEN